MCIVAHPDDAEISAGGTIAMLTAAGIVVRVCVATVSERDPNLSPLRLSAAHRAGQILGHQLTWLHEPYLNQVEEIPQYTLVGLLDQAIREFQPDIVITHSITDSHEDHLRLNRAVVASSRCWRAAIVTLPPAELRTQAYLRFIPSLLVDITPAMAKKMKAIDQYSYEGQGFRKIDKELVEVQAQYFGALRGTKYAEAFKLTRQYGFGIAFLGE